MKTAIVLTLHGVTSDGKNCIAGQEESAAKYTIRQSTLGYIVDIVNRKYSCSLCELAQADIGQHTVITFDDGLLSDYSVAFPMLLEKGIHATFFITTENIGKPGYMNKNQILEMATHGMEIASHGLTHRYLIDMPYTEAHKEIRNSKDLLEGLLGRPVSSYAPVGGHYSPWMINVAKESGYNSFATMIPGLTSCQNYKHPLVAHRNHIQSHHQPIYISSLLNGDKLTLTGNRVRYSLLNFAKRLMGMDNYDRLKRIILNGNIEQ